MQSGLGPLLPFQWLDLYANEYALTKEGSVTKEKVYLSKLTSKGG